jgi:hypothetical protein
MPAFSSQGPHQEHPHPPCLMSASCCRSATEAIRIRVTATFEQFSSQMVLPFTSPAPLRCCRCLPSPLLSTRARRRRDTPPSRRFNPPCSRPVRSVSPALPHLVRRVPHAALVLMPPSPPHLIHRWARAGRATASAPSASGAPRRLGRPCCLGNWARPDRRPWAKVRPSTVHPGFQFSFP